MNNLFKTFNVTSQKEFDRLVEGMDLDENQLVQLFDIVSRDEDVLVARKQLLECSAMFGNGTYEILEKQFKKQSFKRTLKENEELPTDKPMSAEEEVKEEGPKADSELAKVITSMTGVIEKTDNKGILDGIIKTIDSKLAVADNLDQKQELMDLKVKAQSKMGQGLAETVNEWIPTKQLIESILEWRKYCGFISKDGSKIIPLEEGKHHLNYYNEDSYKEGWYRFGVTEYKNDVIGYLNGDTYDNVIRLMKQLDRTYLKNVPVSYYMLEYLDGNTKVRIKRDRQGREIYEHDENWYCSPENIEKQLNEAVMPTRFEEEDTLDDMFKKLERPITYNITINYNKEKEEDEEETVKEEAITESQDQPSDEDNYELEQLSHFIREARHICAASDESIRPTVKAGKLWQLSNEFRDFFQIGELCNDIENIITIQTINATSTYTSYNDRYRGNIDDEPIENLITNHCEESDLKSFIESIEQIMQREGHTSDTSMWDGSDEGTEQEVEETDGTRLKRTILRLIDDIKFALEEEHTVDICADLNTEIGELYEACTNYSEETDNAAIEFIDSIKEVGRDTGEYDDLDSANADLEDTKQTIENAGFDNVAREYLQPSGCNDIFELVLKYCKDIEDDLRRRFGNANRLKGLDPNQPINKNDDDYELDESLNQDDLNLLNEDGAEDFIIGAHNIINSNDARIAISNEILGLIYDHEIDYPDSNLKRIIIREMEKLAIQDSINSGEFNVYEERDIIDDERTWDNIDGLSVMDLLMNYMGMREAREFAQDLLDALPTNDNNWSGDEDEDEENEQEDAEVSELRELCNDVITNEYNPDRRFFDKIEKIYELANGIRDTDRIADEFYDKLHEYAREDEENYVYRTDTDYDNIDFEKTKEEVTNNSYSYLLKNFVEPGNASKIIDEIEEYYEEIMARSKKSNDDDYVLDESKQLNENVHMDEDDINFLEDAKEIIKNYPTLDEDNKEDLLIDLYDLAIDKYDAQHDYSRIANEFSIDVEDTGYEECIQNDDEIIVYEQNQVINDEETNENIDRLSYLEMLNLYSSADECKEFAKEVLNGISHEDDDNEYIEWEGEEDEVSGLTSQPVVSEPVAKMKELCQKIIETESNHHYVEVKKYAAKLLEMSEGDDNENIRSAADDLLTKLHDSARDDESNISYDTVDDYDNINDEATREAVRELGYDSVIRNYMDMGSINRLLESIFDYIKIYDQKKLERERQSQIQPRDTEDDYALDESKQLVETIKIDDKMDKPFIKHIAEAIYQPASHYVKVERLAREVDLVKDELNPSSLMDGFVSYFETLMVNTLYEYNNEASIIVYNENNGAMDEEATIEKMRSEGFDKFIEDWMINNTDMLRDVLAKSIKWFEDQDIDLHTVNSFKEHHSDEITYDLEESNATPFTNATNTVDNLKEGDVFVLNGKRMTVDTCYGNKGFRLVYDDIVDEEGVRNKFSKMVTPYKMVGYQWLINAFAQGNASMEDNRIKEDDYVFESYEEPKTIDDIIEGTIWVNKAAKSWEATVTMVDKEEKKVKFTWEEEHSNGYMTLDADEFLRLWEPIEKHEKPLPTDDYDDELTEENHDKHMITRNIAKKIRRVIDGMNGDDDSEDNFSANETVQQTLGRIYAMMNLDNSSEGKKNLEIVDKEIDKVAEKLKHKLGDEDRIMYLVLGFNESDAYELLDKIEDMYDEYFEKKPKIKYDLEESYKVGDVLHNIYTDAESIITATSKTDFGQLYELKTNKDIPYEYYATKSDLDRYYVTDEEYNHPKNKANDIWGNDGYDDELDESVESYPLVELYKKVKDEIGNLKTKIMDERISKLIKEWCQNIYGPISSYNSIEEQLILVSKYYRDAASDKEENYEKRIARVIKSFTDDYDPEDDDYLVETPDLDDQITAAKKMIKKGDLETIDRMRDSLYGYNKEDMKSDDYARLYKTLYYDYRSLHYSISDKMDKFKLMLRDYLVTHIIDYVKNSDHKDDYIVYETDYDEDATQEAFANASMDDYLVYLDDSEMEMYVHNWLLKYGVDSFNRGQDEHNFWSGDEEQEQTKPVNQPNQSDPVVNILEDYLEKHQALQRQWEAATTDKYVYYAKMRELSIELVKKLKLLGYDSLVDGLIEHIQDEAYNSGDYAEYTATDEVDYETTIDRIIDNTADVFKDVFDNESAERVLFNPLRKGFKLFGFAQSIEKKSENDDDYSLDESLMETRGSEKSLIKHTREEIIHASSLDKALDLFCDDYDTFLEYGSWGDKFSVWTKCFNTIKVLHLDDLNIPPKEFKSEQFKELIKRSYQHYDLSEKETQEKILAPLHNEIKEDLDKIIFAQHDDEYTDKDKEEDDNDYEADL